VAGSAAAVLTGASTAAAVSIGASLRMLGPYADFG